MTCKFYDLVNENVGLPGCLSEYEDVGRCAGYGHVKCSCGGEQDRCQFGEMPRFVPCYYKTVDCYDSNEHIEFVGRQYYCGNCDAEVERDDKYCHSCGHKL